MDDASTSPTAAARYRLETFGTLALLAPSGETILGGHGHHRRRLALLAVLAVAGERGRSRDQLLALFWPEVTHERARHSLDQRLYALRATIDEKVFAGRDPVRLDPAVVTTDIGAFEAALTRGDLASAVAIYRGPFLDGFHLGDALEFERWLDVERSRLEQLYASALARLAERAESVGDRVGAVDWRRRLAAVDPLSARTAVGLIRALRNAGDQTAALRYAERYEALVEQELDTRVPPEVAALVSEMRSATAPAAPLRPVLATNPEPPRSDREAEAPATTASANVASVAERPHAWKPSRRVVGAASLVVAVAVAVIGARAAWRQPSRTANPPVADTREAALRSPPVATHASGAALTRNIAAYELLLRGRDPVHLRTPNDSGPQHALAELQEAVALDPGFAAAYATMPYLYADLAAGHATSAEQAREYALLADSMARRALALDPMLPDAHAAYAVANLIGLRDVRTAEVEFRRAIALGGVPRVHEYLSKLLSITHRPQEALAEAMRAAQEDPLSASATADLGSMLCQNHRYDEGLATLARLADVKPPLQRVSSHEAFCFGMQGKWREAAKLLRTHPIERLSPFLGYALARSGDSSAAREIRERLLARWRATHGGSMGIAIVSAGLGDTTQAFAWLDRAGSDRSLDPVVVYPVYAELMNTPRWSQFLARADDLRR